MTSTLVTLINSTGRSDEELAARSGVSPQRWRALRRGALPRGAAGPWRPRPEIVESLALGLDTTAPVVRRAIVEASRTPGARQ
jgi:hypothetical protein